ncbi:hypothetical protein SUGI_1096950 [Cryptomeria japonica]|nr:hypothetical protein SUGI_1096950 [Cryptomeria japonica]
MFREISSTIVPSSSPAFLVGATYTPSRRAHRLYILDSQQLAVYPFSLDFMGRLHLRVLTSCKGIVCCRSTYLMGGRTFYYICNPVTRTWRNPPPFRNSPPRYHSTVLGSVTRTSTTIVPQLDFYGLAFDSATRSSFNVAKSNWSIIDLPSRPENSDDPYHWSLAGSDGNVFPAYKKDLSLWKLNEEHNMSWSELQLFPRSLREENTRRLNSLSRRSSFVGTEVVANSCGWILVYMRGCKMIVFDAKGGLVLCIQDKLLDFFDHIGQSWIAYGYEINNVWWP